MSYMRIADNKRRGSASSIEFAEDDKEVPLPSLIPLQQMAESNVNFDGPSLATTGSINMDFLATIAPPVVTQPQAFTDAMLDPASRGLLTSLTTKHMSGATLQRTLRHSADQLQRTVQGQFVSLKGNMSYKDLLAGLIYEGEMFQAMNQFTFMNYTYLQFCDENAHPISKRSGGICLLTNKRVLFLSSQLAVGTTLVEWGDAKKLPGGYSVQTSCNDTTYYLPLPLRCLRSVEMCGETGVRGEITVYGHPPCCFGLCGFCGLTCCQDSNLLKQWDTKPVTRSQVQEMRVTIGLLMPPWDRKMFLNIHIDPNVPLPVTRDFVALLQKNSPSLS
ncbi:uncharacterized protein LOC111327567 isoform X1 [Stylophora pistillata]|uniref:Uncharacterized protein n=1 Tax=Stylophora pistillata TaxID=50429 RepID=A0A2B4S9U9_STYPI|nr:uncharacterized protein LOC111327567 isoform X1 [Stylophora pistillata]PFX27434.1 hypothetical protein AWC38_SpisGene7862 [Stylophora pistillata]